MIDRETLDPAIRTPRAPLMAARGRGRSAPVGCRLLEAALRAPDCGFGIQEIVGRGVELYGRRYGSQRMYPGPPVTGSLARAVRCLADGGVVSDAARPSDLLPDHALVRAPPLAAAHG